MNLLLYLQNHSLILSQFPEHLLIPLQLFLLAQNNIFVFPKIFLLEKLFFLIFISVSFLSKYLIIIPVIVHSFKYEGNTTYPIIPLIIVVFPAFDGTKNGIKITS